MLDLLLDALLDGAKMLPFLFAAYFFIEYLEHRAGDRLQSRLRKLGPLGPLGGALLGVVPQCGFAAVASNFYAGPIISPGTLIAVFLSTSDEAVPVLLAHPQRAGLLLPMLAIKAAAGLVFGLIVDAVLRRRQPKEPEFHDLCQKCDCAHHGILRSALYHTVQVFAFILIINLVLGAAMELAGSERISALLLGGSVFQPFLAALIGMIPNCAASVLITELFAAGSLGFGSCIAGLCAGAGVGLVVLFRTNRNLRQNLTIVGILYACSVATGLIADLFF